MFLVLEGPDTVDKCYNNTDTYNYFLTLICQNNIKLKLAEFDKTISNSALNYCFPFQLTFQVQKNK